MKKLFLYMLVGLLWSNVGLAEILKFDCNYYSGYNVESLKTNLRIIDTKKSIYKIILVGNDGKQENYELPIKEFEGNANRNSGLAIISLDKDEVFSTFSWEVLGEEGESGTHVQGKEYEGFFKKNTSSCYLIPIPINLNLYRAMYSPYVLNSCERWSKDGEESFHFCLATFQEVEINREKRSQDKCNSVRQKINNNNAYASTNAGNFLLGVLEGMWEDLACDY
tara:strand:+ start:99 stop:767 length:669 start_codon:yes stop_codon:yes gene_type:complete